MVCLDGSNGSIRALRTAILFARQSGATIVGVHSNISQGSPCLLYTSDAADESSSV